MAQGLSLRVRHHRVPGHVHRHRHLGAHRAAALHDRRLLRQETARAQDREQQTAQAQVRLPGGRRSQGSGVTGVRGQTLPGSFRL